MRFDELDQRMRAFETEFRLPAEGYVVVRVDGRGFTRLTKRVLPLERPFDAGFRDHLLVVAERLMTCGFKTIYGYVQSDEASILLDPADDLFGRRAMKLASVFAGEASAALSVALGQVAAFDGRAIALPDSEGLVDYFRWRAEDARRNALHAHLYWALRRAGKSGRAAENATTGVTSDGKIGLLANLGIDAFELPAWELHGVGLRWVEEPGTGFNPKTGETVPSVRRRLRRDLDLPIGDAYGAYVLAQVSEAQSGPVGPTAEDASPADCSTSRRTRPDARALASSSTAHSSL
jgi:tRNA(His) 5'-end guanylyltransferase